jgi:hypothetical protein
MGQIREGEDYCRATELGDETAMAVEALSCCTVRWFISHSRLILDRRKRSALERHLTHR